MKPFKYLAICVSLALASGCGSDGDSDASVESRTGVSAWARDQLPRTTPTAEPVEINQLDFVFNGDPNDVNAFDDLF